MSEQAKKRGFSDGVAGRVADRLMEKRDVADYDAGYRAGVEKGLLDEERKQGKHSRKLGPRAVRKECIRILQAKVEEGTTDWLWLRFIRFARLVGDLPPGAPVVAHNRTVGGGPVWLRESGNAVRWKGKG